MAITSSIDQRPCDEKL